MCNPRVAVKDRGESRGRGSINFGCSVTTHTTQHTPPSFPSFIPSFPPYPLCHSPPQLLPASLFSTSKSNLIPVGEAKDQIQHSWVSGVRLLPSLSPLLLFLFGVTNEEESDFTGLIELTRTELNHSVIFYISYGSTGHFRICKWGCFVLL
ncbi:hypothetical protein Ahy_A03g012768 isoform A [Arachis hypogaea]|uniref:Uncharacterized protein n=1 Tax=Arachis hypogaea TaxID=3818 RepID=A0A445DU60_ARAHY|nr:hypothetical protein Ahy_A03g012768 isoform A [Arachis hypogaea]